MAGRNILLVEGPDDEHVVKAICGARGLGKIDLIFPCNGKDELLAGIPVRLKESEVAAVGIVIDADTDISACWDAVRGRVKKVGFDLPRQPDANGTIIVPENSALPRLGVWVMPNNQVPGILEDFLSFLITNDNGLFEHLKKSIDTIPETALRFDALKKPKAQIHTWLAWQEEPGKPLGVSITAKYLDSTVEEVAIFSEWLKELFFCNNPAQELN
jgi:hypothetical protein